ncbi:ABC transporter ATP-binding protein [Clostridium botulinum]|uniref:ABC transporter ATP-binding protein n=1 Tax=Clostridium botulinum TaxID=1491 RepID=UPI0006A4BBA2|nr:ABC transporter ATP-binding protein [Clostridium botulinum]KOC50145.1 multidrug ABC transporter ATP-binding protein [Clostridium botulinum]NFO97560.1 ABC transporter ATP-binding protein [Clostridium botulinum]OOV50714.1 multidrug ABC transporter ATP-binding protein [Clostridium botulinum D/C]OOV55977.1 multidrug ABC transporter ATP-binding protein [Clostridium botulinum D/C]OOV56229.1 multidrug ABC transporter ATP-binding protein [Clostridium botulinum D/C]
MVVLSVNNLKKNYNNTNVLKGINLEIHKGEFLGIMGASGSGKTTLLNILSGVDKLTSGKIELLGRDINKLSKNDMTLFRRNHLGFVFQEFNLLDSLTLKENIMLPLSLECKDPEKMEQRTNDIMNMFDILKVKDKYPYLVSGGQQQRTAISRAIINNPDIIFADEPTGNLDSKASNTIMKYFEKLNTLNKNTIIVVTHDPFTASYCNRIVFIEDGIISSEITKKGESKKSFFDKILESFKNMGSEDDEF